MSVLLINGSPNAKGCTYTALAEVAKMLNSAEIETEIIQVGHKDIRVIRWHYYWFTGVLCFGKWNTCIIYRPSVL